jgi:hypothetical protein
MNIEESDIQQAILDTGDCLGYFHAGDSHRGYMARARSILPAGSGARGARAPLPEGLKG